MMRGTNKQNRAGLSRRSLGRGQRGMTLWMIMLLAAMFVIIGGTALKAAPTYFEYMSVKQAIQNAQGEVTPAAVRDKFQRSADVENIASIAAKDLVIEDAGNGALKISFDYEKVVPLAGPVSLLIRYAGTSGK